MNELRNSVDLSGDRSCDAETRQWVAPLQSMTTFSATEFTQSGALPPADDGNGTWTQS
ncbi:hypothetical protein TPR58_06030 [Sphingomonas sp. HF-S3]|uniref:Uncharacterized protein n=1 Tax=Sphingomonas rustica TaxID=3103142 RepID=A0ABV0B763_9SPHN